MTTPQATTSLSQSHDELLRLFTNWAHASFEKSIDCVNERDFYLHVQKKLDAKVDLTDDLPELKTLKASDAKAVVKRMMKQAGGAAEAEWELKPAVAKLFRTTIRSHQDDLSLLPCFDVEYKATTTKGDVTVAVKTWRRNVDVTISGNGPACELLHGQIVIAGMRN